MLRTSTFVENGKLAIATLWDRRFRSFLTILGVFIGAVIIVGVASVLNGFRASVVEQVEEFGTNNIYIYRFPFVQTGRMPPEVRNRKPLKLEDAWAIRDLCPSVRYVSPGVGLNSARFSAVYKDREIQAPEFRGGFPESEFVGNTVMREGRYFTEADNLHRSNVAVVGHNIAEALFPAAPPSARRSTSTASACAWWAWSRSARKDRSARRTEEDNLIITPYYTFHKFYPNERDYFIAVLAKTGELNDAIEQISELLRRRAR
jgi:putative ABC transport system permease protein